MAKNMKGKYKRCQVHYINPATVATCRRQGLYDYICKPWQVYKNHKVILLCNGHTKWIKYTNKDEFDIGVFWGAPKSQGILSNLETLK